MGAVRVFKTGNYHCQLLLNLLTYPKKICFILVRMEAKEERKYTSGGSSTLCIMNLTPLLGSTSHFFNWSNCLYGASHSIICKSKSKSKRKNKIIYFFISTTLYINSVDICAMWYIRDGSKFMGSPGQNHGWVKTF